MRSVGCPVVLFLLWWRPSPPAHGEPTWPKKARVPRAAGEVAAARAECGACSHMSTLASEERHSILGSARETCVA
ncbi:unnamed protein product [Arctia plantaginis]|uniref:Secreted protein n=1 Tax=Arctia plantaginis TaxID=874455 RepID=A0A8S1B4Z6_ARCPL|nr:unnamed protein product [Arctia plantaginis]